MTHLPAFNSRISGGGYIYRFECPVPGGGVVKKIVQFALMDEEEQIFNLGFGDELEDGTVDDRAVSGAGEIRRILATVAAAAYDFTDKHPGVTLYFSGSTLQRTRVYHRALTVYLPLLSKDFHIFGLKDNAAFGDESAPLLREPFNPAENYIGFLAVRKKGGRND